MNWRNEAEEDEVSAPWMGTGRRWYWLGEWSCRRGVVDGWRRGRCRGMIILLLILILMLPLTMILMRRFPPPLSLSAAAISFDAPGADRADAAAAASPCSSNQ